MTPIALLPVVNRKIEPVLGVDAPRSKWFWSFGPDFSIRWNPRDGDVPNRFHRWMQRVFLGIYWRREQ